MLTDNYLKGVLPEPDKVGTIPENAIWLAGEGAGSWFVIEPMQKKSHFTITRFSPGGKLECEGIFVSEEEIDPTKDYSITYPSHCGKVTMLSGTKKICLTAKS